MAQLDGVETLTGIFRVRLAETADGIDWKLQTWVEKHSRKLKRDPKNSKLMTIFLESGRSQEELDYRLDNMEPLTDYETELLRVAEIDVEKDRRFLELAKGLVGPVRFIGIVGECKADALEGRKAIKSPTARLIWRITEALPEKQPALSNHLSLDSGKQLRDLVASREG